MTPLERAVEYFGSQSALARAINVAQSAVNSWLRQTRKIPPENAILIELATAGQIQRHELRPDLWGGTARDNVKVLNSERHGPVVVFFNATRSGSAKLIFTAADPDFLTPPSPALFVYERPLSQVRQLFDNLNDRTVDNFIHAGTRKQ